MSDLISRAEAIKAIEDLPNCYNGFSDTYDKACIIGTLEEVPSAEPERKKGKWIDDEEKGMCKCSNCKAKHSKEFLWNIAIFGEDIPRYCPTCGADMRQGEEE